MPCGTQAGPTVARSVFIFPRLQRLAQPGLRAPTCQPPDPRSNTPFPQSRRERAATFALRGLTHAPRIIPAIACGTLSIARQPMAERRGPPRTSFPVPRAATVTFCKTASASPSATTSDSPLIPAEQLTPPGARDRTSSLPDRSGTLTGDRSFLFHSSSYDFVTTVQLMGAILGVSR